MICTRYRECIRHPCRSHRFFVCLKRGQSDLGHRVQPRNRFPPSRISTSRRSQSRVPKEICIDDIRKKYKSSHDGISDTSHGRRMVLQDGRRPKRLFIKSINSDVELRKIPVLFGARKFLSQCGLQYPVARSVVDHSPQSNIPAAKQAKSRLSLAKLKK